MRQWSGRRSECDYDEAKVGPACKLSLIEQFFLTLVRIRLGLPELDVAVRFGISRTIIHFTDYEHLDKSDVPQL